MASSLTGGLKVNSSLGGQLASGIITGIVVSVLVLSLVVILALYWRKILLRVTRNTRFAAATAAAEPESEKPWPKLPEEAMSSSSSSSGTSSILSRSNTVSSWASKLTRTLSGSSSRTSDSKRGQWFSQRSGSRGGSGDEESGSSSPRRLPRWPLSRKTSQELVEPIDPLVGSAENPRHALPRDSEIAIPPLIFDKRSMLTSMLNDGGPHKQLPMYR